MTIFLPKVKDVDNLPKGFKLIYILALCVLINSLTACIGQSTNKYGSPAKGAISNQLVKDWRNTKNYPQDNDAEYYLPKYDNTYKKPAYNPYKKNDYYPQDNDQNYQTRYPKYDPEADNGGFYQTPGQPPLKSRDFNYPLYYD